jgi:hypothetical protein
MGKYLNFFFSEISEPFDSRHLWNMFLGSEIQDGHHCRTIF